LYLARERYYRCRPDSSLVSTHSASLIAPSQLWFLLFRSSHHRPDTESNTISQSHHPHHRYSFSLFFTRRLCQTSERPVTPRSHTLPHHPFLRLTLHFGLIQPRNLVHPRSLATVAQTWSGLELAWKSPYFLAQPPNEVDLLPATCYLLPATWHLPGYTTPPHACLPRRPALGTPS
jgi:hypothetical protein